jgi:hypothetical protein
VKNKTDKRNDEANNNSESNEQQLTQVDDSKKFEELMIDLDSQKKETERRSTLSAEFIFGELLSVSLSDDVVGSQESVSSVKQICVFTIFYSTNTILIQGVKTSE